MPELPEVETVRRGLAMRLPGARVRDVIVRQPMLRWPVPPELPALLLGKTLASIGRRSKYLLLDFGSGQLIAHLGMSGNLLLLDAGVPPGPHDHVDIVFDRGLLRFRDPRRFGALLWHASVEGPVSSHPRLAALGPEPFDPRFCAAGLYSASRGKRQSIKQFLLAGQAVVGVGNIYASESLHRAGLRPTRAAGRLTRAQASRLVEAVRQTLADAIEQGGTTLRDFAGTDGAGGYFQLSCRVYGRRDEPCGHCGSTIRRIVQQQRATYFCPTCQP